MSHNFRYRSRCIGSKGSWRTVGSDWTCLVKSFNLLATSSNLVVRNDRNDLVGRRLRIVNFADEFVMKFRVSHYISILFTQGVFGVYKENIGQHNYEGDINTYDIFYGPELDIGKKRELIKSFTETDSKLTGIEKSAFVVYFRPSLRDNVGGGGDLLSEKRSNS